MNRKTITILLTAALMSAALASCGQTSDGNDNESTSKASAEVTSASDETVTPEETTAEEETEVPEETTPEEEEQPVESEPDDSSEAEEEEDPEKTEPTETQHDHWVSQIAEHTFENGQTFKELYSAGMANVYQEGKAYAVVPMEGGAAAGSVYYKVYNSTDGGENWLECENYREDNGGNSHYALEDGGIMLFSNHTARAEKYPVVYYLYFDGIGIKSVELKDVLAEIELSDGTLLKDVEDIYYESEYIGDYKFELTLKDTITWEDVYNDTLDLSDSVESNMNNLF